MESKLSSPKAAVPRRGSSKTLETLGNLSNRSVGEEMRRSLQLNIEECGHRGEVKARHVASPEDSSRGDLPTEQETQVVFEFPDGSITEGTFKMGQTVEVLKAFLSSEFDFEMQNIELRYDGQVMLDPLSLSDFEHESRRGLYVQVDLGDDDAWLSECKSSKK